MFDCDCDSFPPFHPCRNCEDEAKGMQGEDRFDYERENGPRDYDDGDYDDGGA